VISHHEFRPDYWHSCLKSRKELVGQTSFRTQLTRQGISQSVRRSQICICRAPINPEEARRQNGTHTRKHHDNILPCPVDFRSRLQSSLGNTHFLCASPEPVVTQTSATSSIGVFLYPLPWPHGETGGRSIGISDIPAHSDSVFDSRISCRDAQVKLKLQQKQSAFTFFVGLSEPESRRQNGMEAVSI
jgi:hypothetical protein